MHCDACVPQGYLSYHENSLVLNGNMFMPSFTKGVNLFVDNCCETCDELCLIFHVPEKFVVMNFFFEGRMTLST